jgi:class 3 adenylate cyclase/predicted ATPase
MTVLFCGLAGSAALPARLDPEDLREVISAFQSRVGDVVRRHGGHVASTVSDAVLAYFGWPEAHEDDAERAVRAGLSVAAAVAGLGSSGPLAAVGIATGPVVAGGAGEAEVVGVAPSVAARLQAAAAPGAVVMDDATRRLLGALFDCEPPEDVAPGGRPAAPRAWRVLGEGGVESRFEALRSSRAAPLVGREEELELLLRRWRRGCEGEGQVVLLGGEPGIGKSRLTAALQEALAAEAHGELVWHCSPQHTDSPLHPVVARLGRAAGLAPDDAPEARLAKLEALLAPGAPSPEEVALLAELLSVPTLGRYPALELGPQRRRERTLEALVQRAEALARRDPLLAVLEDAHWADPTTRELLDLLVTRVPELPVLLVVTHRPEFQASWAGLAQVTELRLGRLGRRDNAALVEQTAGGRALPRELVEAIAARADGVPLFVEELTKAVLEVPGWAHGASAAAPETAPVVPATLQGSLLARLDRLGPAAKGVAQAGAAIGREFAHGLLAAVAGMPEPQLLEAVERLVGSGLVHRRGAPPGATYVFKHALVQDAAYGTLLRGRRRELHALIARALEAEFPDVTESQPELLAHHCIEAGRPIEGIGYCLKAAERAMARSAAAEAIGHLNRGLGQLEALADGAERDRSELLLRLSLGRALIIQRGSGAPDTGRAFVRAYELARRLGDSEQLFLSLYGLCHNQFHRIDADLDSALHFAREMIALGERTGDPQPRQTGYRGVGAAQFLAGNFAAAREGYATLLSLFEPERDAALVRLTAFDPRVVGLANLALIELITGAPGGGSALIGEALERAGRLGHQPTLAYALQRAGMLSLMRRDRVSARAQARELVVLAARHGLSAWGAEGALIEAWSRSPAGAEAGGALAAVRAELQTLWSGGGTMLLPAFLCSAAEIGETAGDPEAALSWVGQALEIVEKTNARWYEAEILRLQGRLLTAGPPHEAERGERALARAVARAREQGARLFELRAALDLARLWSARGRGEEARGLLAPIYPSFAEDFGLPDLAEARALLLELDRGPEARGRGTGEGRRGMAPGRDRGLVH